MSVIDCGDAMIETKQAAPGTRPDHVYGFGLFSGSANQDVDVARLMLAAAGSGAGEHTSEGAGDA